MSRDRTTRIKLDTRSRQMGTTISNPTFNLSKDIPAVSRARVLSVSFANTLNNVDHNHNRLALTSQNIDVVPGFYSPQELAEELGGVYDPESNTIDLELGTDNIVVADSTLAQTLGLQANRVYTGSVELGPIFLANPIDIEWVSGQLQCYANSYSDRDRKHTSPFFECPVKVGFGSQQTLRPYQLITLDQRGAHLGSINVCVQDALDGRELDEIGHWSMVIEFIS